MTSETNDLPPLDQIEGSVAAEIVGHAYPTTFNAVRESLQLVWDRASGTRREYPSEFRTKPLSDELKAKKQEFDSTHVLVVPEWGGLKLPGQAWQYSRRRCLRWRKYGPCPFIPEPRKKARTPRNGKQASSRRPKQSAHDVNGS